MITPEHLPEADDPMERASLWCIRLAEENLSESEWAQFEQWHAVPGHSALLERATVVWRMCGDIADAPEIIPLRTDALTRYHSANRGRWGWSRANRWPRLVGIAASIALVLGTFMVLRGGNRDVYETGIGERRIAALSDGSRLSLDAATKVDVAMGEGARKVELRQGRALFDVAKDPLRPFSVAAGDKLIVAVGTSFSVELVDGEVRVNLFEGQVEIRDRGDTAATRPKARREMLVAGQGLVDKVGDTAFGTVTRFGANQALDWEQGIMSFDNENLGSAIERMNRHSETAIRLGSPGLAAIRIDGEFQAGDTDAFVEGVAAVHNLTVSRSADEVILRRD